MTLLLGYGRVGHGPLVEIKRPARLGVPEACDPVAVVDDEGDRVRLGMALKIRRDSQQEIWLAVWVAVADEGERSYASGDQVGVLSEGVLRGQERLNRR